MDSKLDLTIAQVVQQQINDYVHAEVLFYPVGMVNGLQMPQLSIGLWLATAWQLQAVQPTAPALIAAQAEVRRVHQTLPELYEGKARREFKSRLDTWSLYLDEALLGNNDTRYITQVPNRLKLELLRDDVPQNTDQLFRLTTLDAALRARLKPGKFILEPELSKAAPPSKVWWLWGTLG